MSSKPLRGLFLQTIPLGRRKELYVMKNIIPWAGYKIAHLPLDRSYSSVEIDGNLYGADWQQNGSVFTASVPGAELECRVEKTSGGIKIYSRAVLEKVTEMFRFNILCLPAMKIDHYFGCGPKMGRAQLIKFPAGAETQIFSCHNVVLTSDKVNAVISSPLNQRYENFMTACAGGEWLTQFKFTFEVRHCDDTELIFDPVSIGCGDGIELLREYGRDNVETERDLSAPPEYGWNSWDYYRWIITEDEVLKNAQFIANDPVLKKYIKRIIIDDGWQYCYGEWEANSLFPSGMKSMADKLSGMGFEPGLWFAPSIIEPHCRIAQWDQDMLAMSEGGQPCACFQCMKRYGFVLDPTVKKTQDHLRALFDRYAGMGYRYFKLDFLAATTQAARFHDRSVSRSQIIRRLLAPIVEGINGRAEILGCNYHFSNGNSFASSVRIGGDIHAKWGNICANTRSVASMFWANKVLWHNDPDFAVCRGPETSNDPDLKRLNALSVYVTADKAYDPMYDYYLADVSADEAEVLLSLDIMAAGAINLSDNLPLLNERGLQMLRKVVSAEQGETAIPLDLFESELPVYWLQKTSAGHRLLIVNWQDSAAELPVDWARIGVKPSQARDFWSGAVETPADKVMLEAHSCKLWEF